MVLYKLLIIIIIIIIILHCVWKKGATLFLPLKFLPNADHLFKFFHKHFSSKLLVIFKCISTLPFRASGSVTLASGALQIGLLLLLL